MIIFGYHSGTQNTQNSTYVRHLKWDRLERGHFELHGIRQQDSDEHDHYYQKFRLAEFFSKVLESKIIIRIPDDIFVN